MSTLLSTYVPTHLWNKFRAILAEILNFIVGQHGYLDKFPKSRLQLHGYAATQDLVIFLRK